MFNKKEIFPIGIDITDKNIYAAQFQNTRQGMVVGHLLSQELDGGLSGSDQPDNALLPVLKAIAKNRHFKGKVANLHLPEEHINCIWVTFDLGPDEVLEEAIARECRRSLSYPLEEAVVDYVSLVESKAKKRRYKVAIVTVRKEIVEAYLLLARRAGLSVGVIDLHLSSLLRLHRYLFMLEKAPVILCNVDDTKSLLSVVTKNRILAQRYVPWGFRTILGHLDSNLELGDDSGQAAGMLRRYGLIHEKMASATGRAPVAKDRAQDSDMAACRALFQLLTPYVEELIQEFYQITGYVRSEIPTVRFKEIVIYGWASAINFLDQYIENRLDIPTKTVNPMEKLSWKVDTLGVEDNDGVPYAPALGLALRKVSWL